MSAPDNTSNEQLDLSNLQSLSIGPDWATSSKPRPPSAPGNFREERESRYGDDRPRGGGHFDRDRRQGGGGGGGRNGGGSGGFRPRGDSRDSRGPSQFGGGHGGDGGDRPRRFDAPRGDNRDRGGNRSPFDGGRSGGGDFPIADFSPRTPRFSPVVEVAFFPEEKPFTVLTKAIKSSLRTYDLFEIARLIIDKPDRFTVACRPFDAERNPDARLWQSVPDQLPFLSESDAVAHVMKHHLDLFFTSEVVEVPPPKGTFLMVSKCGLTGEILGPPNYHAYQQTLREHHAARLPHTRYESFTARIESVRDQAVIDAWLKRMTQVTRYTLKTPNEGDPASFDSFESARAFLIANRKDKVARSSANVRFSGKAIESLPFGPLRSAIENELNYQRKFPLDTANSLRGRLRKLGFVLYKRGPKDVTYVAAVERKLRAPGTVFADSIQQVVDYIEKHPKVKARDLPEKLLGIVPGEQPEAAPEAAAPAPEAAAAPAETPATPEAAPAPGTPATPETAADVGADLCVRPASAPDEAPAAAPETPAAPKASAPAAAPDAPAPAPETPAPKPSRQPAARAPQEIDLNNPAIRELLNTLRWLIAEGYVTEFSDGALIASPMLTDAQAKERADSRSRQHRDDAHDAPPRAATGETAQGGTPRRNEARKNANRDRRKSSPGMKPKSEDAAAETPAPETPAPAPDAPAPEAAAAVGADLCVRPACAPDAPPATPDAPAPDASAPDATTAPETAAETPAPEAATDVPAPDAPAPEAAAAPPAPESAVFAIYGETVPAQSTAAPATPDAATETPAPEATPAP